MEWTTELNTAFESGKVRHSATTVAACKQECLSTANCNGFDFNPRNKPTGQCWLTGPWSGQNGTMQGVTHYTLARKCQRTYTQDVILLWETMALTLKLVSSTLIHGEELMFCAARRILSCVVESGSKWNVLPWKWADRWNLLFSPEIVQFMRKKLFNTNVHILLFSTGVSNSPIVTKKM